MMSIASLMGSALHLPKPYWILMTVLFVTQNGYGATRVRILHRSVGTLVGLVILKRHAALTYSRKHYAGGHAGTNAGKLSDYS